MILAHIIGVILFLDIDRNREEWVGKAEEGWRRMVTRLGESVGI